MYALGVALVVGAFGAYRAGAPLPFVITTTVVGVLLLAQAHRMIREDRAGRRAEADAQRRYFGPSNDPIEPDIGVGLTGAVLGILALITLALEFHPVTEWLLDRTPWRIVMASREPFRPLMRGDVVLVVVGDPRPRTGTVVWVRRETGGRHRATATVLGVTSDSLDAPRWIRADGSGALRPRWVRGYGPGERLAAASDSLLVCFAGDPAASPQSVERIAVGDVEGMAIAIVAPPRRWRRLS